MTTKYRRQVPSCLFILTIIFSAGFEAHAGVFDTLQNSVKASVNKSINNFRLPASTTITPPSNSPAFVVKTTPSNLSKDVGLQPTIEVTVSGPSSRDAMKNALSLYSEGLGASPAVKLISVSQEATDTGKLGVQTTYRYQVMETLLSGRTYRAVLSNVIAPPQSVTNSGRTSLLDGNGRALPAVVSKTKDPIEAMNNIAAKFQYAWTFNTSEAPWIKEVSPKEGVLELSEDGVFHVTFTKPMDEESLKTSLTVNGSAPAELDYDSSSNSLAAHLGPLDYAQKYSVKISKDAQDAQGMSLKADYRFMLVTPKLITFNVPNSAQGSSSTPQISGYLNWVGEPWNSKADGMDDCPNKNPSQACLSGPNSGGGKVTLMCPKDYYVSKYSYENVYSGFAGTDRTPNIKNFSISCHGIMVDGGKSFFSMTAWPLTVAGKENESFPTLPDLPKIAPVDACAKEDAGGGADDNARVFTAITASAGNGGDKSDNRLQFFQALCSGVTSNSPFVAAVSTPGYASGEITSASVQHTFSVPAGKAIVGIDFFSGSDVDGIDSVWAVDVGPK